MGSEYIKLSRPEVLYGQKSFLKAQLDVLDIVKHYLIYQKLRKDEFMLKIELKNSMDEVRNKIIALERMLPRTYTQESDKKKKIEIEQESKEVSSLQQEIDLIKQKLTRLR